MGYIDGFEDIMAMETGFLQYTMKLLEKEYAKELRILRCHPPERPTRFRPFVLMRQKNWWQKNTTARSETHMIWSRRRRALIGQYFKEEYDADFVFVTHYPSKKRPFYAMDDPADPDLYFKL